MKSMKDMKNPDCSPSWVPAFSLSTRLGLSIHAGTQEARKVGVVDWLQLVILGATRRFSMATTTVGVKLDDETRARLKMLGEARQRSTHWLMREAIRLFLDTEERYEREKAEDLGRWERYLATGEHLDHEEMGAWLDGLAEEASERARRG